MKIKWKTLIICILIPVLVGVLSGLLTQGSMESFQELNKPVLSPPGWIFPIVWPILYVLMGLASYFVLTSGAPQKQITSALNFYFLQLVFNFFWSILFFNFGLYLFSFIWLIALWILIIITTIKFYSVSHTAGYLMLPYLLWVTFAGYLNLSIYLLNK